MEDAELAVETGVDGGESPGTPSTARLGSGAPCGRTGSGRGCRHWNFELPPRALPWQGYGLHYQTAIEVIEFVKSKGLRFDVRAHSIFRDLNLPLLRAPRN